MKKIFFLLTLLLSPLVYAQQLDTLEPALEQETDSLILDYQAKKNILKLSLTSLAFRNVHLQYERVLNKKISISLSFGTIFEGDIPFLSSVESTVDDAESFDKINEVSLSYYSITPEVRFYLGKKGYGKGFYLAPFYRNSRLTLDGVSFEYPNDDGGTSSISTSGSISGNTVGLLIGSQFNLGKSVVLDWWIVGPHYGSGSGTLTGVNSEPFSALERSELDAELNELNLPFVDETTEVSAQDIKVLLSGPWGGVRAGLSLGFRF
jgi:hypothetical protein